MKTTKTKTTRATETIGPTESTEMSRARRYGPVAAVALVTLLLAGHRSPEASGRAASPDPVGVLQPASDAGGTVLRTPTPAHTLPREAPTMKKLSPVIVVDAVEPCLPFWRDRLGFEVTATVPHEDALGFAILHRDGVEVMYQSRASVEADIPRLADELDGERTALFIELTAPEDLDEVERALEGAEIVVPRRQTFYGMDEIYARADCGTVVGFAVQLPEAGGGGA